MILWQVMNGFANLNTCIRYLMQMSLSENQIYHADQTAFLWRVLPGNIWIHNNEKSADEIFLSMA